MTKQESQFFDAMRLDVELDEKLHTLSEKNQVTVTVKREYIIGVEGI